ncbi:acyl-CoA dehydrogenase, partial [Mycobacterium sp. 20091114027_K0903767]|nr:acyl-CoA dehydrogenase [Mycobacterium sp. 20091114027_K0903767]
MTNTLPSKNGTPSRPSSSARQSAVGLNKHKRTATDIGLALITPIVGQEFLDRYGLRDPLNRGLKYGVKQVFSTAGAATRQFQRIQSLGKAPTRLKSSGADYFDLTPDEDQQMIVE